MNGTMRNQNFLKEIVETVVYVHLRLDQMYCFNPIQLFPPDYLMMMMISIISLFEKGIRSHLPSYNSLIKFLN